MRYKIRGYFTIEFYYEDPTREDLIREMDSNLSHRVVHDLSERMFVKLLNMEDEMRLKERRNL